MNYNVVEFNVFHKNEILNNMYNISKNFKEIIENDHKYL